MKNSTVLINHMGSRIFPPPLLFLYNQIFFLQPETNPLLATGKNADLGHFHIDFPF